MVSPEDARAPGPVDFSYFGEALAFDGSFNLLVGRPANNGVGSAYLFVYRPTIGTWGFRQKFVPGDISGHNFGASVAIAGTTAFVGYSTAADNTGAVSVFAFDVGSGTWKEQPELLGSDVGASGFGENIAVNQTGTKLLVSSYSGTRSARLYTGSSGSWTPSVEFKTRANSPGEFESVALSDNLVLVGSPNAELDLPDRGVVETFTATGTPLASMRATADESFYYFALSVALSGKTAVLSAPEQQNILGDLGTADIYLRNAQGDWEWQAGLPQTLNSYEAINRGCTTQVAIDGDTIVVGEPNKAVGTHLDQGVASIYVRSGATWALQETLFDRSGQAGDLFGCSVAIAGNTVIAGAPGLNTAIGGGYVSTRTGIDWSVPTKLIASDGKSDDSLGLSAAVANNTAVLGSWRNSSYAGAAYVFTGSGSAWTQSQKLTMGTTSGQAEFGTAISLSRDGKTLAVGAPYSKVGAVLGGNVFVYVNDGRSWTLQQTLNPLMPTASGLFGASVSVDGNTVVVGEPSASTSHVFVRAGSTWAEKAAAIGAVNSQFGSSVSASKTSFIVGASYDQHSGRAYILGDAEEIFANGFD